MEKGTRGLNGRCRHPRKEFQKIIGESTAWWCPDCQRNYRIDLNVSIGLDPSAPKYRAYERSL
jgi:hypothetical protein